MRTIEFLGWTLPVLALQLLVIAAAALAIAFLVTAYNLWRQWRADEAAWQQRADDARMWDDDDQADALRIAAEHLWREDLAQIHADTIAIDEWRDAGYPPHRQPYAITAAEERSDKRRAERRRYALATAEGLTRLAA